MSESPELPREIWERIIDFVFEERDREMWLKTPFVTELGQHRLSEQALLNGLGGKFPTSITLTALKRTNKLFCRYIRQFNEVDTYSTHHIRSHLFRKYGPQLFPWLKH